MSAIVYLLQVSACMGLFYGFYYLMLSRLTFFTINRWYLVATLFLSFAIPLLTITVRPDSAPIIKQVVYVNQFQTFQTQQPSVYSSQLVIKPGINWLDVLKMGYLVAVMGLFIRLIIILAAFFANIKNQRSTKIGNVHILHGDKKLNNGSFLNYIFLNDEELNPQEIQQIIEHEMLHVKLLHSVDRILIKIAQIILWFNPFVYLYARAIEQNHEFEVDREIGISNDKSKYADMLLHLSVAKQGILYNSFSVVPLKKRVAMLFTKPTNHMKKVIYLLALPVVMLSCLAFARLEDNSYDGKYSVIKGEEKLGNNVVVEIDGKSYNKGILYKISAACIKKSVVSSSTKTGGKVIENTKVYIETVNGIIEYMTSAEKENLTKERSISKTRFYTRLNLTGRFGIGFDKIIIQLTNGSITTTVPAGGKVGLFIDSVFYNESEIANIPAEKIKSIIDPYNAKIFKPGEHVQGFSTIFYLKTTPLIYKKPPTVPVKSTSIENLAIGSKKPDTNKNISGTITKNGVIVGIVKLPPNTTVSKGQPKTDYATQENDRSTTAAEKRLIAKTLEDPAAPFFNRFHFQREGGVGFDVIAFKLRNGGGSAILDAGGKAGAFIDGKFYNEDNLKKLSSEEVTRLVFDYSPDRNKREKIPGNDNYAMPFSFKSAKTDTLIKK